MKDIQSILSDIKCYSKLAAVFNVLSPHKDMYAWIHSNYCNLLFHRNYVLQGKKY